MKKPEMTKKTSTPTNPPADQDTPAWKSTTRKIMTPRRPSMSERKRGRMGVVSLRDARRGSCGPYWRHCA
ncbi:hypothetical protein BH11GEM1_BH11GEM1_33180 [soil metagenome]